MIWNSEEQLEDLLCELVSWDSQTGTTGEIAFAHKIKEKLLELPYFQHHDHLVQLHDAGKERNAVTALYKRDDAKKTIVLISHFDTVHTEEFSTLDELAFQPKALTLQFQQMIAELPEEVQQDVASKEYLFGRGTMDMKMGLALHLHLLEQASEEKWPINLLLLTVPDEEVGSAGMRAGVQGLIQLREQYNLSYSLFLNGEPSFSQTPQDEQYYIYSGTIGKIMPSALFYGRETHAGEPLSGMNAHYMASFLTKGMEYNSSFKEEVYGEETPLPVCLKMYDLKKDYSTQTSNHVAALYNVFVMKQNAAEVMMTFKEVAGKAMKACQAEYEAVAAREHSESIGKIQVISYVELLKYATEKYGDQYITDLKRTIISNRELDEREMSIQICDQLMAQCQELAPATILFFAPPYYPAINSSADKFVQEKIKLTQDVLNNEFNIKAKQIHYFNGISDLSYVNYDQHDVGWKAYPENTPIWNDGYHIPFEDMQQLQAPVLNIGPFGKDAHKLTERLHKKSAFVQTPYVLRKVIKSMF